MALTQIERLILNDSIDDVDTFVMERSVDPEFVLADFIAFKKSLLLSKYEIEEADMTLDFLNGINVSNDASKALRANLAYKQQRSADYPPLSEQLDEIFHNGLDGWKATIQAVKDKNPKPLEATP